MDQSLIDKFIKELDAHIRLLEKDYNSRKKLFDVDAFLRRNFSSNDPDTYNSLVKLAKARCEERDEVLNEEKMFESVANECYELLKFFEPNTSITKEELKEAFFTCYLANKNDVMKKYDRYKKAMELLNTLKQLFVRHQFRKSESNSVVLEDSLRTLNKFKNLHNFLVNGATDVELENVDTYQIPGANLSQEEWLEVYSYILMTQIKSYKREEEKIREESKANITAILDKKAKELQDKILEELPPESKDIIRTPEEEVDKPVLEDALTGEHTPVEEQLSYIQDETLLAKYSFLEGKVHEYRKLGNISLTKEQSFSTLYDSLSNGNSLDNIRLVYKPSDYIKFLYYCFKKEFQKITGDIETMYPQDELEEFAQLLMDDIDKPLVYLAELEVLVAKEKEAQERLNGEGPIVGPEEEEKPFKLIFYGKKGTADIIKDIKKFTPEKIQDLIEILTKMEEGKLEKCMVINKQVPVAFRAIRGDYIFVTFRMLNDGHILVVTASNLDELNSNLHRLSNYDSSVETELGSIIRDGSLEYAKLIKENEEVKNTIYSQGITKGV